MNIFNNFKSALKDINGATYINGIKIKEAQSLPQIAKDILMKRDNPHIDYTNQMLIINPDGRADSWVPSSSDVFAEDWEVVAE